MKIAIIDDEKPARSELRFLINEVMPDSIIQEFSSGEEVLEIVEKETYDLFCIDISLGDINGITLGKTIKKISPKSEIVFATAYNNYGDKAFEIEAMYYLLKPFSENKVKQMLDRYKLNQKKKDEENVLYKIPICVDKSFIMVDIDDIVYIECENRACIIYTKNQTYKDSNTLNFFEQKLANNFFFRIHKSFLINLKYISEIHPWFNNTYCVKLSQFKSVSIPVSRNKIKDLKKILHLKQ